MESAISSVFPWLQKRIGITGFTTDGTSILPVSLSFLFYSQFRFRDDVSLSRCTVGVNLSFVICLLTPSVSPTYRAALSSPVIALQNMMACRAFRLLSLGSANEGLGSIHISIQRHSTLEFALPSTSISHTYNSPGENVQHN